MIRNNTNFILAFYFIICFASCHKNDSSIVFQGSYLGQKPPGMIPEMFAPGFISTGLNEGTCTFSPNGKELFYHIVYRKEHKIFVSIVGCNEKNGVWSKPEMLNFSGTEYQDMYPFLSYDGNSLYFLSNRPTNKPELNRKNNFWIVRKESGNWGTPEPLRFPINGKGDVSGISVSNSGMFYYTLITEKEQAIYRSQFKDGKFAEPERLPDNVNSTKSQFDGVIAPDESYMILCVYGRDDSFGSTDLYVTFKDEKDNWSPVKNLGEMFNTQYVDGPATISADGKYIFFNGYLNVHNWSSDVLKYDDIKNYYTEPGYGNSDVYWVDAKIIEELKSKNL